MCEFVVLLFLALFFLFYTFGGFHAIIDGWRPWKHGIKWWKYYDKK